METPVFTPKLATQSTDQVSLVLFRIAQILLLGSIILAPLVFVTEAPSLLGVGKVYVVLLGLLSALVFFSLSVLRGGTISLMLPYTLIAWLAVSVSAIVSGLVSATPRFSLIGDVLNVHTAGFLVFLGLLMAGVALLANSKKSALYVYSGLLGIAFLLSLQQSLRLFFGPEILSFGVLPNISSTLLGSFNDFGLFLGLTIIIALIALEQLPLPRWGVGVMAVIIVTALLNLVVINFGIIWILLALFSLTLLMYALTKDRFSDQLGAEPQRRKKISIASIILIIVVFVTSVVFLIGGNALGVAISQVTNVSYVEVRPSASATLDIARNVYQTNAFTGIGPNLFADAWRLYKDQSINQTVFWNTNFAAGNGYIPTWFVTTGVLGTLTWLIFLGVFTVVGVRMLLRSTSTDSFWFFIGTISFVSALYIWILAFLYVPGPMVLMLAAVCTGFTLVAKQALLPGVQSTYQLATNARSGFVLIVAVMLVIISSIAVGYGAVRQFAAAYTFVSIPGQMNVQTTPEAIENRLFQAQSLFASDVYIREVAALNQGRINQLLSLEEPTPSEQQQFEQAITQAITAAEQAIRIKPTDPRNWVVLGDIYNTLAAIGIEGAAERSVDVYKEAQLRDPQNPTYALLFGVVAARSNDSSSARENILEALRLKPNFTDALFVLSQLDVAEGNVTAAIESARALISLEPNNAGRYYQLGVLLVAQEDRESAIDAFSAAIEIDTNYANARYLRALQYFELGEVDTAIAELEIVREMNPDNEVVGTLIEQIRSGEVAAVAPQNEPIAETNTVTVDNDVTTTTISPDTDLITPVNFGGVSTESSQSTTDLEVEADAAATE